MHGESIFTGMGTVHKHKGLKFYRASSGHQSLFPGRLGDNVYISFIPQ